MDKKPQTEERPRPQQRETQLRAREEAVDARDRAADYREMELIAREERARLRDDAIRARAEADEIRADREQLLAQMRDANERLVLATMKADDSAEAAAYNEERFRCLITTSAALVWNADASGRVHVDAESWKAFTGLALDDKGDPAWRWLEAVHPGDRDHVRDAWAAAVKARTPYECQHRLRAGDNYVTVVARAAPILRQGVVREWIGMMIDVTDRVRVEEAREQFIAILGHDLRTPLTAIVLGSDALVGAPEPYGAMALRMQRSATRMEALIRDVMDFTRGRLGGGIPVTLKTCDLRLVCTDVVDEMKRAHPDRDLSYEIEGDLNGECDNDRIEQVLSNLLSNAITHGLDPIRVRISGAPDEITMIVANQGTPIAESQLATLFEPFARGPRRDGDVGGLGLGLFIVREIVRAHGGAISVASTQAEGTRFTACWPRTAEARARLARR